MSSEWEKPEALEQLGKTVATLGVTLTGIMKALTGLKKAFPAKATHHVKTPAETPPYGMSLPEALVQLVENVGKLLENEGKVIGILKTLVENQNTLIDAVAVLKEQQKAEKPKTKRSPKAKPQK